MLEASRSSAHYVDLRNPASGPMFPGASPVPVADAARAYVESVEGAATGQVLRVGY